MVCISEMDNNIYQECGELGIKASHQRTGPTINASLSIS